MDSRGYGSTNGLSRGSRRLTGTLVLGGLIGICVGIYGLLDGSTPRYLGAPMLAAGVVVAALGLTASGQRTRRTRYRPDRWRTAEVLVAWSGVFACAVGFFGNSVDADNLVPSLDPLTWPQLPLVAALGVVVALLPALVAPRPAPEAVRAPVAPTAAPREPVVTGGRS
jgi:energy-coupling factor transport system permease protein